MLFGKEEKMKVERQKAKIVYDFVEDIFFARPVNRQYDSSIQIGNFIFDLNKKNKIIGFEILNASELFGVSKLFLHNIKKGKIEIKVRGKFIMVQTQIQSLIRNSMKTSNLSVERVRPEYLNESNLQLAAIG